MQRGAPFRFTFFSPCGIVEAEEFREKEEHAVAQREDIKYRLADAAKRCLRDGTVDSLTVSRLVREAGVARQTFYRHFADKYDLVNWYFGKLLLESFEHMGSGRTVREGYERKFAFIRQESVFFRAAFRSQAQNSLRDHDLELILRFFTDLIREKTGKEPDADTAFLLEAYCNGAIAMTVKWVLGGMKEPCEVLARRMVEALPARLASLFREHGML